MLRPLAISLRLSTLLFQFARKMTMSSSRRRMSGCFRNGSRAAASSFLLHTASKTPRTARLFRIVVHKHQCIQPDVEATGDLSQVVHFTLPVRPENDDVL